MTSAKRIITPSALRLLLTLSMFLITGLGVTGFIFAQQKLSAYAVEVSQKKVDAAGSKASLQTLQSIEKELNANQDTVTKAKNIKHVSALPQFKAIEDLRNHAKANNLSISNISFTSTDASGAGKAPVAPAAGAGAAAPLATPAASDGVDITFSLGSGPVSVTDLINFMYDIEHSTPKMQLQGIGLSGGDDKSHVSVEPMTVKMFTKNPGQG